MFTTRFLVKQAYLKHTWRLILSNCVIETIEGLFGAVFQGTEPHFIRCLKPNETKRPLEWDAPKVLNQLFSLSILEALQLRQIGYSYRRTFEEFVKRFRWLDLGAANSDRDREEVARSMLEASGLPRDEWAVSSR